MMTKTIPLLILLSGCGSAPDDGADLVDGKADGVSLPAPGDTADRLYFDATQSLSLDGVKYYRFTAQTNHSFTVEERAHDDEGATDKTKKVGFKLYRLAKSNHYYWKLVTSVDGKKGDAKYSYKSGSSHNFLLEVSAGQFPTEVEVSLSCAGGDHRACALGAQPGDTCGSRGLGQCDDGLYCQFAEGTCGAADQGGQCAVQPTSCPRLGLACFPVCGCDGKTYCAGCDVALHAASIASRGQCGCDENQFEDADNVSPAGTYTYIDPATNSHYTYTFSGRAGFTSQYEPGCLFATPIHCNIAVAQKHGIYGVNGDDTVTLSYDDGSKVSMITQTNCVGADRLVGTDYGAQLTLTH